MSQPPKPPQPPQGPPVPPGGGFGAPQDPPPGFGAPPPAAPPQAPTPTQVSPAVQPGYGYPQTPPPPGAAPQTPPPPAGPPQTPPPPPGAPAAPAGYGYPAQPPAPDMATQAFGAATPPPAPGPYGAYPPPQYPGGPYPGAPTPGGPGGGAAKKRMAVIVSAAVALVLVVGGGVWFATKGGDDKKSEAKNSSGTGAKGGAQGGGGEVKAPQTIDAKLLFSVDQPKVDDLITVKGQWATDQVYAKADVYKVVGYGLSGGQKWEIPLDGEICWSSKQTTSDGKTAVLVKAGKPDAEHKYGGPCSQVVALDLNSGKKLWQKTAKAGDQDIRFDEVTVGGGTVAAGGTSGGAAWSLADGKELWKPKPGDDCRDDGYGGGGKLVAVRRCGDYSRPQMQVQTVNPATGAIQSAYKVPPGLNYVHVASTDPLVIAVDAGDSTGSAASDFLVIDDSAKEGKLRSKISTENGKFTPKCPSTEVEGCFKLAISKDTLYLPSEEHQSGNAQQVGRVNEIVGFDLATGQSKGKADGMAGSELVPLGLDKDGYPIGYQEPTYKAGGQVVRVDPKTFKTDVLMRNPAATAESERRISPTIHQGLWAQNRLFLSANYANKPSSFSLGKEYLAMAFGGS
ncbi:hypothetical protein BLA24_15835 [Streptomyces cinnamoneus]|uniref:Pyrrolo-quinoline quinone repeat domain-containing protein n=1 Tax=Streptomyces cinnamoneus TaxID=53446 RepID=A0A2G1XIZ7_STRCJ|nr:PQQ-binding-like beta-propeller repeat protein [Streptomyces cinnamoneus]PHQ51224.1 hypothetical protein BLA24_15835 [Streptomyces cinnamoneus]PPT13552.1 hypothetical protein CYQ11_12240 [Streptomyces cinnamoneus]